MSAAEKLKALIVPDRPVPFMYGTQNAIDAKRMNQRVLRALPQIVALVEAAEAVRRSEGLEGREAEFVDSPFPTSRLAVALAALDWALGDVT